MDDPEKKEWLLRESEFTYATLLGTAAVCIAAMLALLSVDHLDVPLRVSLYCFCGSIPPLIYCGGYERISSIRRKGLRSERVDPFIHTLSLLMAGIGLFAVPFHFGVTFGLVFIASAAITLRLVAA